MKYVMIILVALVAFVSGCGPQDDVIVDPSTERAPAFVKAKPDYTPTKVVDFKCPTTRPKIEIGDDGTGWWRYRNY